MAFDQQRRRVIESHLRRFAHHSFQNRVFGEISLTIIASKLRPLKTRDNVPVFLEYEYHFNFARPPSISIKNAMLGGFAFHVPLNLVSSGNDDFRKIGRRSNW